MAGMQALDSNSLGLTLGLCTYHLWTKGNEYLTNAYMVVTITRHF